MKCFEDLKKSFYELKQEVENIRKCDECAKGPCVGRLLRGDFGWIPSNAVYVVDSNIYINRCSMILKKPKLKVRIERGVDGDIKVYYPNSLAIRKEKSIKSGDISVLEFVLGQ